MFKKILIAAVIFFVGFALKDIKAGEQIYWEDSIYLLIFAIGAFAFKEWVDVPYDWDKHKNKVKQKEKSQSD